MVINLSLLYAVGIRSISIYVIFSNKIKQAGGWTQPPIFLHQKTAGTTILWKILISKYPM